jgi:hypothetical protein
MLVHEARAVRSAMSPRTEIWTRAAYVSTTRAYEFSGRSALRNIELEIPMSPVNGSSSSKTRKIAL